MRVLVQRVTRASVSINNEIISSIGSGLLLLVGIAETDTMETLNFCAKKCLHLRIFNDENYKMNRSLLDTCGEVLAVSQFTLYGSTDKGRRPSFENAAKPETALPLFNTFVEILQQSCSVKTGVFGEYMEVSLVNDGPVTFLVEK